MAGDGKYYSNWRYFSQKKMLQWIKTSNIYKLSEFKWKIKKGGPLHAHLRKFRSNSVPHMCRQFSVDIKYIYSKRKEEQ